MSSVPPIHVEDLAVQPSERVLFCEKEGNFAALSKEKLAAVAEVFEMLRTPFVDESQSSKRCVTPLEYRTAQDQLAFLCKKRELHHRLFEVLRTPQFWAEVQAVQNRFCSAEHQSQWSNGRAFWLMPSSQLVQIAEKSLPLLEQFCKTSQEEVRQKLASPSLEYGRDFLPLKRMEQYLEDFENYLLETKKRLADEMALRLKAADIQRDPLYDDTLFLLCGEGGKSEREPENSIFIAYTKCTGSPRRSLTQQSWKVFALFIRQWGSHEAKEIYQNLNWHEEHVPSPFFALQETEGFLIAKHKGVPLLPAKGELEGDQLTLLQLFYAYLKVFEKIEEACSAPPKYEQVLILLKEVQQAIGLYASEIDRFQQADKKASTHTAPLIAPLLQQYLTLERGLYERAMQLLEQSSQSLDEKMACMATLWESFVQMAKERATWKKGGQLPFAVHTQELQLFFQRAEQQVLGKSLARKAVAQLIEILAKPESYARELENPQDGKGGTMRLKEPDVTRLAQAMQERTLQLPEEVQRAFEVVVSLLKKNSVKQQEFFSALQTIVKHSGAEISVQSLFKLVLHKWLFPLLKPNDESLRQFIGQFPGFAVPVTFGDSEKKTFQWVLDFLNSQKSDPPPETFIQDLLQLKIVLGAQSDKRKTIEQAISQFLLKQPPKQLSFFELIVDQLGTPEQIQRYGRKRFRWLIRQSSAALVKNPFFLYHYASGILTESIHKEMSDFCDHHALQLSPELIDKYAREESVKKSLLELYDKSVLTLLQAELDSQHVDDNLQIGSLPFPSSPLGVAELYKWLDQIVYLPWSVKGATLLAKFGVDRTLAGAYLKKYFYARLVVQSSEAIPLPARLSETYKAAGIWANALQEPSRQFFERARQLIKQGSWQTLLAPLAALHAFVVDKECSLQILPTLFHGYREIQTHVNEAQTKIDDRFSLLAPLVEKKEWNRIFQIMMEAYQTLQMAMTMADEPSMQQECNDFQALFVHLMSLPLPDKGGEFDKAAKSWLMMHRSSFQPPVKLVDLFTKLAFQALEMNHSACFRILDQWGINRKKTGQRAASFLHHAAFYGSSLAILQQIKSWPEFNIQALTEDQSTALHSATRNNHHHVIDWLIHEGCPIDSVNEYERTPLIQAAYSGAVESLERLLKERVDRKRKPKSTDGPLHAVIMGVEKGENVAKKRKAMLELLLNSGADINEKNGEGKTILHLIMGSWSEHSIMAVEAVLKFLLEKGANCDAPDPQGLTPAQFAEKRGNKALGELLTKLKAQKQHPLDSRPSGENLLQSAKQ
ncbi:MAG: ankyrin repeat domain-containing protein [Parachlamydia sp.]|nr:ankyrin repeat domain-containing protein [Parachlamydia sp.]